MTVWGTFYEGINVAMSLFHKTLDSRISYQYEIHYDQHGVAAADCHIDH